MIDFRPYAAGMNTDDMTVLNNDNFRRLSDEVNKNYRELIIKNNKPYMALNLSASPTVVNFPTAWVGVKIPFNTIQYEYDPLNQLTLNSNGIKIGKNISRIRVFGSFAWYNNGGQADMIGNIYKSATNVLTLFYENAPATTNYITVPFITQFGVAENDIIYLYVTMGATGNRNVFSLSNLTVQVLD